MQRNKLISIVGTTASGKSSLGIELAAKYGGEIVSADSRQVYKHLDLGTGKVTREEMEYIPHHLIDILELNEPFSMADFQPLAYRAIDDVISRGALPFLVGGTGLYTRSVVEGYSLVDVPPNEELRAELADKNVDELRSILMGLGVQEIPVEVSARRMIRMIEKVRAGFSAENESSPRYDVLQLGISFERDELYERIEQRLDARLEAGMVDEVKRVIELGATSEFLEKLGLEYRYTYRYVTGQYSSYSDYRAELLKEICHFAKRQMTWFKKEKSIIWLDSSKDMLSEASEYIDGFLKQD